jgi:hypothetical protein
MPFAFDSASVGNQLQLGENEEKILNNIRGSADLQGPILVGSNDVFPKVTATLMVGPLSNGDSPTPAIDGGLCSGINHSPYSLAVSGDAVILDHLDVNGDINAGGDIRAQGEVMSRCGTHILSAKKNFDIPHPSKPGWRLRHTCLEGPQNDVYFRGKLIGQSVIDLPEYWTNFVDSDSITVSITPIGKYQNIFVEKIEGNKIFLNSNEEIKCHFHVYAERVDGEKLIVEYEGETPADYPGNNDEYSVVGWNYDVRN